MHFPDLEVCCDWSRFFSAQVSRRSWGRNAWRTTKNVCVGGYTFHWLILKIDLELSLKRLVYVPSQNFDTLQCIFNGFTAIRCFQFQKKVYQSSDRTVEHLCLWSQNEHGQQFSARNSHLADGGWGEGKGRTTVMPMPVNRSKQCLVVLTCTLAMRWWLQLYSIGR